MSTCSTLIIFIMGLLSFSEQYSMPYTLYPRTAGYCKKYAKYDETHVVQSQIILQTSNEDLNVTTDYDNNYACEPSFLPFGKLVQWKSVNYWYIRMKIEGSFAADCKARLIVNETHEIVRSSLDDKNKTGNLHIYDCKSKLPVIIDAEYRKVKFIWESDPGSSRDSTATIYISRYVQFINITNELREPRCFDAPVFGYFCNTSAVCIPGKLRCDELEDCFDDGSDEYDCPKKSNGSLWTNRSDHSHGWITNLPWIALGVLPIILVFALARICSQKRHLDIDEDYKMGFNTEDEEDCEEGAVSGPGGGRSEHSCSPDAESTRSGANGDYDEGYSLPRHKKTMSASSDYLPANFAELTASPANRRRPENDRIVGHQFGAGTPTKADLPPPPAQPQQQHVVAVQINNPVYGNNVYVDVPTQSALREENYTRPNKQVVVVAPVPKSERPRHGHEEYTPLLPPLPHERELRSPEKPNPPYPTAAEIPVHRMSSSGTNDDYEEDFQPSSYDDDLMTPPPPSCQQMRGLTGERPEMLHLKPLLRPGGSGSSVSSPKTPSAPNGNTSADHNNRDSDYDKNYIVV